MKVPGVEEQLLGWKQRFSLVQRTLIVTTSIYNSKAKKKKCLLTPEK